MRNIRGYISNDEVGITKPMIKNQIHNQRL